MLWMSRGPVSIEGQIAVDEALVDRADRIVKEQPEPASESHPATADSLLAEERMRLWEADTYAVVLGRSSKVDEEVDVQECRRRDIPIFRRSSGGATVVIGPGCLMYALLLSHQLRPECQAIQQTHQLVMEKWLTAFTRLNLEVQFKGTCDLTYQDRKFSGNSLRCKRAYTMYHGTILYQFDLDLIQTILKTPPRRPEYRADRSHADFVTNLPASAEQIEAALRHVWDVTDATDEWPEEEVDRLVAERYSQDSWNLKR